MPPRYDTSKYPKGSRVQGGAFSGCGGGQPRSEVTKARSPRERDDRPKHIHSEGEHLLNCTDLDQAGPPATIQLWPGFYDPDEAEWALHELISALQWGQGSIIFGGKMVKQPRLTCWFGEVEYCYSGIRHKPSPLPELLSRIKSEVEAITGLQFNAVLCNRYRNGKDSISWHADDEPALGSSPSVASLSFGATRRFQLRAKGAIGKLHIECSCHRAAECTCSAKPDYEISLRSGTLLLMKSAWDIICHPHAIKGVQEYWDHRVPKEYHDRALHLEQLGNNTPYLFAVRGEVASALVGPTATYTATG